MVCCAVHLVMPRAFTGVYTDISFVFNSCVFGILLQARQLTKTMLQEEQAVLSSETVGPFGMNLRIRPIDAALPLIVTFFMILVGAMLRPSITLFHAVRHILFRWLLFYYYHDYLWQYSSKMTMWTIINLLLLISPVLGARYERRGPRREHPT